MRNLHKTKPCDKCGLLTYNGKSQWGRLCQVCLKAIKKVEFEKDVQKAEKVVVDLSQKLDEANENLNIAKEKLDNFNTYGY